MALVGTLCIASNAHAACTSPGGTTLNCTGDITGDLVDGGLDLGAPYDTFNIFALTAPLVITPTGAANSGIDADVTGTGVGIDLTSDADIDASVAGGTGLRAEASDGFVTVENSGDINAPAAFGISINSFEADTPGVSGVSLTNHGTITALNGAILYAKAGDVTVNNTGNVTGTGFYGFQVRTDGGSIDFTSSGDISGGGYGILARAAAGMTDITLNGGTIYGGDTGVFIFSGTTNTIDNYATITGGNYAIASSSGSDIVNNYGTVTGNVDLGSGTNAFNNFFGGTFNSGSDANLGGGTLTNSGTFSPGNTGTALVTTVTGDFVQTGTGTYVVDVDEGGATASDRIDASGTAAFAGTILPNVIALTSETGQLMIATAAALTSTATVTDVGGYDFSLLVQGGNMLLLTWGSSASESILALLANANVNQRAIAIYLDTLNAAGSTAAQQALIDALLALGETDLIAAINQLTPELYSDAQISSLYASLGFANSLLSCRVNGTTTASIIAEGQCLWAGANAVFLDSSTTSQQIGFTETTGLFAAGAQVALNDVWRLGVGASYQQNSIETATNTTSEGQQGQAGLALKYNSGPFLAAATLSGGRGWYDTMRPVTFTGFTGTAMSDSTIDVVNGGARLAYVFGAPQLYFKPVLDAAVTRLDMSGFTETGGGAANLTVASSQQTVYTIARSLEIGTEWWWGNGTLVRPYLRAGATFYEGNDFALNAGFAGAPVGVTPFTISTDMDDVMGTLGAGLDLVTSRDTALHLGYDAQLGETTQIHAFGLKGSARF